MKKALSVVLLVTLLTGSMLAGFTMYDAMALGNYHGSKDADNAGFFGAVILGTLSAIFVNTGSKSLPANRVAYINSLTDDPEAIAAYEEAYSFAYSNRIACNTWRGYVITSVISSVIAVITLLMGAST
ncbi:hypothetical protein BG32_00855 [Mesotoga sp. HF07.pep.5.2.highcov]|uniref:hypothetical protein n=1 Tax=unclassified Mesotoga TaxID=1184398 RepID=UPI0002CACF17|nr:MULTISPECIES: hypothetical protein [unclassified Mesotoga]RLL88858.1 hypothetical protein Y696_01050 [Mesotoga sp. H07pep.5.4]RLL90153.1 hypothetical protein BG32_00855 [Mesotoga sp. HF07.pep.5.2.highcov]CCU85362.1 conserved membrane hypothetical protein [Mesotoga infera]